MTKHDFIKGMVEYLNVDIEDKDKRFTQKQVEAVFAAFPDFLKETFEKAKNEKIVLQGMGTFTAVHIPEKTGTVRFGEHTGETWVKPAHYEMKFKMTDNFRKSL